MVVGFHLKSMMLELFAAMALIVFVWIVSQSPLCLFPGVWSRRQ